MGLVVWQQLEGRQFDTQEVLGQGCQTGGPPAVMKLQVPSCLCLWESCLQLSILQCLMGLWQQLKGCQFDTLS
ncbi:unnamed protein product [Staurois parvus]|uniref:Uncharacterized protein n=1 Tax=Staurois parvus TaxID=386267 RepID=A0ABN9AAY8_9NEOB|nr:unnamed protein product [Staurois parvus]